MVVHHNSHTESSRNQYHLPLRGNHIFAPRTLASGIPICPIWPVVTTTVGFEFKERPLLADTTADPSSDGKRANRP